ncbi:hypothetical protein PVNG_05978 [Plasmodium vivax North Korean]|uniref:CYIR protein n=1 Tax=Plasmodium vivax North Korean TaxID=1035514 RepID=A0A0J9TK06_PLAVI|nr:hypothetical protein PVNG_05978 [Plasmodium vivax North Korean]
MKIFNIQYIIYAKTSCNKFNYYFTITLIYDNDTGQLNILSIGLPLDSFYNNLNFNDKDLPSFHSECESLYREKRFFKYKRLCSILLRFLKESSSRADNESSAYNKCILFNYWMYDELSKKYIERERYKLVPALIEILAIWNDLVEDEGKSDYYNKCKPDFDITKEDDWWQRKKLYDYCVNYQLLQGEIKLYTQNCNHHYTYIKSNTHLYDYFKERCKPESNYNCPVFYDRCKNYDPAIVLPTLSCYNDLHKEEPTAAAALPVEQHPQLQAGSTISSDGSQIRGDSSPPATQAGNVFLGVVVTSMTSGALYKVRTKLFITYKLCNLVNNLHITCL